MLRQFISHMSSLCLSDIFVSKRPSSSVDAFFDVIEKEKQVLSAKREVENRTDIACQNSILGALQILETAREERTETIANLLKR
ncbi:6270_t:CDS:2, partial [Ambispora leptoticha]